MLIIVLILESQLLNFWSTTISLFFKNGMPFQVARWLAWRFNNDSQEMLLPQLYPYKSDFITR